MKQGDRTPVKVPIGVAARRVGLSVPTVRYYEQIGLLPAAPRSEGGQRHYGPAALQRLRFIRRCRDFGFSIEQVRELVGLLDRPDRPCVEARDIAARHLATVRRQLAELRALEHSMAGIVGGCEAACAGGPAQDCSILEDLGRAQPAAAAASGGPLSSTTLPSGSLR
ncbi:helix-turn-helix domain-containing protein [Aquabacterium sp.]|uniref:MerR family transcriptional regulator n=1 Tax=Aquabacterium sp. TaxID=1872578 RepID=UPI003784712D